MGSWGMMVGRVWTLAFVVIVSGYGSGGWRLPDWPIPGCSNLVRYDSTKRSRVDDGSVRFSRR